jgi:hypothetical protein
VYGKAGGFVKDKEARFFPEYVKFPALEAGRFRGNFGRGRPRFGLGKPRNRYYRAFGDAIFPAGGFSVYQNPPLAEKPVQG